MPRCKSCKEKFIPKYFNQKYCMFHSECIKAFSQFANRESAKSKKKAEIARRKKTKKELEALKPLSYWIKKTEAVVNKYIRVRDKDKPCVSCHAVNYTMSAGHYFNAGSYSNVRFNPDNIHGQCWFNCNSNKSGNLAEYLPELQKRIGKERWEHLDSIARRPKRFTKLELEEIRKEFTLKTKALTK